MGLRQGPSELTRHVLVFLRVTLTSLSPTHSLALSPLPGGGKGCPETPGHLCAAWCMQVTELSMLAAPSPAQIPDAPEARFYFILIFKLREGKLREGLMGRTTLNRFLGLVST